MQVSEKQRTSCTESHTTVDLCMVGTTSARCLTLQITGGTSAMTRLSVDNLSLTPPVVLLTSSFTLCAPTTDFHPNYICIRRSRRKLKKRLCHHAFVFLLFDELFAFVVHSDPNTKQVLLHLRCDLDCWVEGWLFSCWWFSWGQVDLLYLHGLLG